MVFRVRFFLRMLFMSRLTKQTRQLLGLDASWEVSEVFLSLDEMRGEITLVLRGGPVMHSECDAKCLCAAKCSIADHSPESTWRHLDTMPFETALRSSEVQDVRRENIDRSLDGQTFSFYADVILR
jgi:hypothetical protein